MKHYNARAHNLNLGLFTDLFILGVTRGAAGVSDFTDADTAQDFTLITPPAGSVLVHPPCLLYTKKTFAAPSLTVVQTTLGMSAGGSELSAADTGMMTAVGSTSNGVALPDGTGLSQVCDGTTIVSLRINTTGANLNALTAGELWIYLNLLRPGENVTGIDA